MRKIYIALTFSLIACSFIQAQENKTAYTEKIAYLLKDRGKWKAKNPNFDLDNEWSPSAFGYQFEKGYAEDILKLKITGFIGNKEYVYWEGVYYWHPLKNRAIYFSQGTGGQVASGETINIGLDMVFEVINPDGSVTMHKDTDEVINENEFKSKSFKLEGGKWVDNQQHIWKRVIK